MERGLNNQQEDKTWIAPMIGDNKVKDRRGVRLLSEILLYDVYGLITFNKPVVVMNHITSYREFTTNLLPNATREYALLPRATCYHTT